LHYVFLESDFDCDADDFRHIAPPGDGGGFLLGRDIVVHRKDMVGSTGNDHSRIADLRARAPW